MGFSASLKVDFNTFKESMSKDTKFGEHKVVFKSGGPNLPEPIGLKLVPITEAFDSALYSVLDQQWSARCVHSNSLLKARKAAVIRALNEYPRLKKTIKPIGTSPIIEDVNNRIDGNVINLRTLLLSENLVNCIVIIERESSCFQKS